MGPIRARVDLRQRAAACGGELAGLLLCLMFAATERLELLRNSAAGRLV